MHSVGPLLRTLLLATGFVWLVAELHQSLKRRPGATAEDRGSRRVLSASLVLGVLLCLAFAHLAPDLDVTSQHAADWTGVVLLWCGIALRLWSFRTLGALFTFTVQTNPGQPVVAAGPYRVVRHPSYTGILLAAIGLGLLIGNWLGLVVLTASVCCGLVYRIHVEEMALVRSLGDDYRDYAKTHKRLIPFVW